MNVDPRHGRCKECGSPVCIVDADDATLTVECEGNGHCYAVEPDAFGEGYMLYYLQVMMEKEGAVE